jgi:isorenieratene synthase
MPDSQNSSDILIIGAGLAGLTAALHLAERGLQVTVLEADPQYPGGRLAGKPAVELDGWTFPGEHGVHGIWSGYINLQAMLVRHHIRPVFVPAQQEDWFYRRGNRMRKAGIGNAIRQSWIPAPFHYLNLFLHPGFLATIELTDWLMLFNVWSGLLFAIGIDPLREDQPLEGMTMQDVIGHWSPATRALFVGLARNGFAGNPEEIPLSGFLAFLRFYTVMRRDAWSFSYLPGDGASKLIDPMVARLAELGGCLVLGARVAQLIPSPKNLSPRPPSLEGRGRGRGSSTLQGAREENWQVVLTTGETWQANQVILATDAPAAEAILKAGPQTAVLANDLYFPRGAATAVARVWFNRRPIQSAEGGMFSGGFTFDNFFWLDQIYEPYLRWSKATGGSAIEVHLYGPPSVLAEPDAVLLARAITDVQAAFPELRDCRIRQAIQRNPSAHTLFGLGPTARHLGVRTPWPDLFCCGDWVRHPEPALFLERACVTGIAAANAILAGRDLLEWPTLAYPPPEALAGWIEKLMVKGRKAKRKRAAKRR